MSDLGIECEGLVRFEVQVLEHLYAAIESWAKAQRELLGNEGEQLADIEVPCEAEEFSMQMLGKYTLMDRTERAMYGTLAVAIAATTEKFLEAVCKWTPLQIMGRNGKSVARPDFAAKCRAVERHCSAEFPTLPGFRGHGRVRALSNCFKHNRGRVQADYAKVMNLREGTVIAYQKEDWAKLIGEVSHFLLEIAARLRGHEAEGNDEYDDYVGIF